SEARSRKRRLKPTQRGAESQNMRITGGTLRSADTRSWHPCRMFWGGLTYVFTPSEKPIMNRPPTHYPTERLSCLFSIPGSQIVFRLTPRKLAHSSAKVATVC